VTNGAKFLLDTNYILGLLKSSPNVLADVSARELHLSQSCYSTITRMELLGFPGIEEEEANLIEERLDRLVYLPLTDAVEERTIAIRRSRNVKLPDAIIAATALVHGLQLLTLDKKLLSVMAKERRLGT
jgi:predicted nucleic acid-binding protein